MTTAGSNGAPLLIRSTRMVSRRQAVVELAVWAAAGALWVTSSVRGWPLGVGIGAIAIALIGHGSWMWRRGVEGPRDFGLRGDNVRVAALPILGFTAVIAAL